MHLTTYGALAILSALCTADQLRGVAPQDADKYVPTAEGKWACLGNPEIVLDWSQVNDDYCDCPDGSDEPGTSACPNGKFWCMNEGHEGQFIPSNRVGDGVCDYDVCCDGSDEIGVVKCGNLCESMHIQAEEARIQYEKERFIGDDKYIKIKRAAKKFREKLEEQLKVEEALLNFHSREIERFNKMRAEKQEQEYGPEFQELRKTVEDSRAKIYTQFNGMKLAQKNLNTVRELLDKLVETYNANLNDAAVKQVVDDYQSHLKASKRFYKNPYDFDKIQEDIFAKFNSGVHESAKSFDWVLEEFKIALYKYDNVLTHIQEMEKLLEHLSKNYNPNFNDVNVKEVINGFQDYSANKEQLSVLEDIADDIKDKFTGVKGKLEEIEKNTQKTKPIIQAPLKASQVKSIWATWKSKLHFALNDFLGVAPPKRHVMPAPESEEEYAAVFSEFHENSSSGASAVTSIQSELAKNYGPDDIYRPMLGVVAHARLSGYDYDFEFVGDITQKGSGGNVLIGTFDHVDAKEDGEGLVVYYENGAKCWNGPKRRAIVTVECGAEHDVLSVNEPEKCEYHFKMKSPLGCTEAKPSKKKRAIV